MSDGVPEVMLQATQREVILHGFQEVTSECQVISHGRAVISLVSMIQNGRKSIIYILYNKTIVAFC